VSGPGLDLGFAFEGGGFVWKLFDMNDFNGFMGAGVCSSFTVFVVEKSLLRVVRGAGVEAVI